MTGVLTRDQDADNTVGAAMEGHSKRGSHMQAKESSLRVELSD